LREVKSYLGDGVLNAFFRPNKIPKLYVYTLDRFDEDEEDLPDFYVKKERARKGKPRKIPQNVAESRNSVFVKPEDGMK